MQLKIVDRYGNPKELIKLLLISLRVVGRDNVILLLLYKTREYRKFCEVNGSLAEMAAEIGRAHV